MIGAAGTCIGGAIGYLLAWRIGSSVLKNIAAKEDIEKGQRIESFRIVAEFQSGSQYPLYQGTCIGHKKICQVQDPFALQNPLINDSDETISRLKVQVTAARDEAFIKEIKVY